MNEALKLAIEKGGYAPTFGQQQIAKGEIGPSDILSYNFTVLDPLFWQALGKALGWGLHPLGRLENYYWMFMSRGGWQQTIATKEQEIDERHKPMWQYHALCYFELKLTNGDEEKFWQELLNQSN